MNVLGDRLEPEDSWVREALDPHGTLPPVILTEATPEDEFFREADTDYYYVRAGRAVVGVADLAVDWQQSEVHFSWVQVHERQPAYRNGMGLATYVLAIEAAHRQGDDFVTDYEISPDAFHRWNRLVDSGVAILRSEFKKQISEETGLPFYRGDAYVPKRRPPELHR